VTADTDAVNEAVVLPLFTVTLEGTVRFALLLLTAAAKFEDGTLPLTLTEQDAVPGPITLDGLQVKPESVVVADCVTEIEPPVPDPAIADPSGAAAEMPANCRPTDEVGVPLAIVAVTFATTPEVIVVSFCPDSTQVTVPVPGLQSITFDAAFAAAPGAIVTLLIDDGYVTVHWSPDGAEPDVVRESVSEAVAPAVAVPELKTSEDCWAMAA